MTGVEQSPFADSSVTYRGGENSMGATTRGTYTWADFADPFFQCWYEGQVTEERRKTEKFKRTLKGLATVEEQDDRDGQPRGVSE